jgi:hypothetical protein
VQYSRPLGTRADLDLWAPTFLAGQFGETALLGFAGPGASQDTSMVMKQTRNLISEPAEQSAFFQRAHSKAQQIVSNRQLAVQAVASALRAEQTLPAAQVIAVIKSTLPQD